MWPEKRKQPLTLYRLTDQTISYPFSIHLRDHVKAFKRFSHPFTNISYPFNDLSNRFNIFFIRLQNTRMCLTLSTNHFHTFLNRLQTFRVHLMIWTKHLNGFLVRLIETWLIFRLN